MSKYYNQYQVYFRTHTTVRCWDCRSKKPEAFQIMNDGKDSISSVQVTDHEILTGSLDGQIRRYDIRNGQMISDEMASMLICIIYVPG